MGRVGPGRPLPIRRPAGDHPIQLGEQHVFHAGLPDTSTDNDSWANANPICPHFGVSSAAAFNRYVASNPNFFQLFALSPNNYAPYPGAVPITVRGTLVDSLAISGLTGEQCTPSPSRPCTTRLTSKPKARPGHPRTVRRVAQHGLIRTVRTDTECTPVCGVRPEQAGHLTRTDPKVLQMRL